MGSISRRIRRWLFLVGMLLLVLFLLMLVVVEVLRWQGSAALDAERAAGRAIGAGGSFADLVAMAPVVDDDRQERLWRWAEAAKAANLSAYADGLPPLIETPEHRNWAQLYDDDRSSDAYRVADDRSMATLQAILDDGPVVLTAAGWLRHDFPQPETTSFDAGFGHVRAIDHSVIFDAIMWYNNHLQTGHESDIFRHLDQLLAATTKIGVFFDVYIHREVVRMRDQIYLRLAAHGQLDPGRMAAWLAEPDDTAPLVARAIRLDRIDLLIFLADRFYVEQPGHGWAALFVVPQTAIADTCFLDATAATWSGRYRMIADALDGGPVLLGNAKWTERTWSDRHSVLAPCISTMNRVASQALMGANEHRMVRACAALITAWRAGGLPANAAQAHTLLGALADATALMPPLIYERLSPSRFRLGVDPRPPIPALMALAFEWNYSDIGKSAGTSPWVHHEWSLELDCAALAPATHAATEAATTGAPTD